MTNQLFLLKKIYIIIKCKFPQNNIIKKINNKSYNKN